MGNKIDLVKRMVEFMAQHNNTIDLDAYAKGLEDMHDYIDHQLHEVFNSHSPIIPEFDTLQEGDWFTGTPDDYVNALRIENAHMFEISGHVWVKDVLIYGYCVFDGYCIVMNDRDLKKTQLTPEEFLRRAENTFKTK